MNGNLGQSCASFLGDIMSRLQVMSKLSLIYKMTANQMIFPNIMFLEVTRNNICFFNKIALSNLKT